MHQISKIRVANIRYRQGKLKTEGPKHNETMSVNKGLTPNILKAIWVILV